MALIGLVAACNLQPPGGSTTLPEATTPETTTPPTTTPPTTTPETSPETTVPAETTVPGAADTTLPADAEEGMSSPWLWIVLVALVLILLVAALMRRNKESSAAASVSASWTERTRSAIVALGSIEATLGRPATLDPADHESMRRSVASARDQSVTFEQLAATAPNPTQAQHAAATADALRVLATSTEIEVEGLSSGSLNTSEAREAAETERRVHLQALHQATERLTQSLQ